MTNSTDVSDMKMTRFGYRVDLIRERHVYMNVGIVGIQFASLSFYLFMCLYLIKLQFH